MIEKEKFFIPGTLQDLHRMSKEILPDTIIYVINMSDNELLFWVKCTKLIYLCVVTSPGLFRMAHYNDLIYFDEYEYGVGTEVIFLNDPVRRPDYPHPLEILRPDFYEKYKFLL